MRFIVSTLTFLCLATSAYADSHAPGGGDIEFIANDALKASGFPLSQIVEADGWLFLSGALGTDPETGRLATGGIEPETRHVMQNIERLLDEQGVGMDRVVKCTVMLADMAEWGQFNAIYKEFFQDTFPARSAFGVNGLAAGARVEVECIARR